MTEVGPREKAIFIQTLSPFLRGIVGKKTTVELKNEIQVRGVIVLVDCFLNVTMENVGMSSPDGRLSRFSNFFIQRKSIRMIRIPDQVKVEETLREQVDIATGKKLRLERQKAREKRANYLRKKSERNMKDILPKP